MEVRSVGAVVSALNAADVKYLIVRGLAVNAYGYERLTRDVDVVIGLEPDNIIRGLKALLQIGYALSIPVTPEEFGTPELRNAWQREKGMVVLRLWSDQHRRTPVDVFVYEPFDFTHAYARAKREIVLGNITAPVVPYDLLLQTKQAAGRDRGLIDIEQLRKLDPYR
jgi:hypothetical protein